MAKLDIKEKIKPAKKPPPLKIKLKSGDDNSQFAENIINTVREPLIVLDSELRIVTASRSFYSFFKVNPEETYGKLIYDIGDHQWDIPKLRELLETILPEKTTFDYYEVEQDFTSIGKHVLLLNARQIERAAGKEKIILLAIEDITERKHKEELLSEKNRLNSKYLEILLNHTHVPIIIWDSSFVITRFNLEFEKLSGYHQTELINKKIDILFPKNKIDSSFELINNTLNDEKLKVVEIDVLTKNKEIKTVLWNSANIFDKKGEKIVATIAQDITERKLIEEALKQERDFSRTIVQTSPTFFVAIGSDGKTIMMNDSMLQTLGYSLSEVVGMDYLTTYVQVDDREKLLKIFKTLVNTSEPTLNENRILAKDGRQIIVEWHGKNILKPNGELNYFFGIGIDITEHKRAEAAQHESHQIIEGIINSIPARVFWKDKNLVYLGCNKLFALDSGFTDPKELIGKDDFQMGWRDQAELYRDDDRKVIESGIPKLFIEEPQTTPEGKTIILLTSKVPLRNSNGEIVGILGTYIDITERKLAEKKLQESEERFRSLYENATIGIYRTTSAGKIDMANPALIKMLGYSSFEELAKRNLSDTGFGLEYSRSEFQTLIERDGEVKGYESAWIKDDGSTIYVRESARVIRDVNNAPIFYEGTVEDITERKNAEETLKQSEEKIRNIFETANEGICVTNESEEIISANKKFTEMVGYSIDEIIGKNFKMFLLEEELTGYNERQKIRQTGKNDVYERRLVRKDSSIIWTTVAASSIVNKDGAFNGSFGMFTDITERKRMVEDLLKLSKAVEQSPASIIITDTKGNIEYINLKVTEITGYQFAEVLGKNPRIFSTGEITKSNYKILWDTVASGKEWRGEFHNKKKNGELYWELALISPIINEKGVITHYLAVKEDITERKRTEEEITMLAHSLRSINECVSITDLDDKILFVNESYLKTYGYDENELIGKNTSIVRSLNNSPELVKAILPSTLEGGWKGELWNKRKDGSEFMIYLSTTIIHNKDRKPIGLIGVATDITERKRTEKELIEAKERAEESDKLKSEFLAQMSHEIRTPLNVIVGNVDYINESLGKKMDLTAHDCFEDIDQASKRIIRTVDLILNSAELQTSVYKPQFVTVDLNLEILEKLYQDHQFSAKQKGLELIYICEGKDTKVVADEYSITQVFANLINNAIKYTKKGKVEILLGKNKTGNVMVEVKDSGIGISKEFLPRIFETFAQEDQGYARRFEGNGLGLLLVKKYCEMNNAVLEVNSEKNVGSAFRIIFN